MIQADSLPSKVRRALIAVTSCVILASLPAAGHGETPAAAAATDSLAPYPSLGAPDHPDGDTPSPGLVLFQLRPRFSYADQSNKPRQAQASNMRLLLGYRAAPVDNFEFTGQIVDVSWLHPLRASNLPGNRASPYPLVGDPDKSDVNLLFADFAGLPDTRIRFGRQAIKLDNERFVGDADVRQMPQVFDAVSVRNMSIPNTEFFAARAWHVRTYFGNRLQTGTTLLNARVQLEIGPSLGAYSYFQDQPLINNVTGFSDNSNRITGARLEGNHPDSSGTKWYYTAEAALQRPYANGDNRIRANYQRLAIGPSWSSYSAQLDYERLGSNNGLYGFQMPLSYNTSQGYAYEFFTTPPDGVRDLSISWGANWGRLNLVLKRHRFKADFGSVAHGIEQDMAIAYRVTDSLSIRGVFAKFRPDASSSRPSADRYYITLQYNL